MLYRSADAYLSRKEVNARMKGAIFEASKDLFTDGTRLVVLVFLTAMYTLLGFPILASQIFSISALYNTGISWFPNNFIWGLQDVAIANVSVRRITVSSASLDWV